MINFRVLTILALFVFTASGQNVDAQDPFRRPGEKSSSESKEKSDVKTEESNSADSAAPVVAGTDSQARITKGSDGWYAVAGSASNADFRLPGKPTYKERSFSSIPGRPAVTNHMYSYNDPAGAYSIVVAWLDLHEEPQSAAQKRNALVGAVNGAVANTLGQLTRIENIKTGVHQGREFDFTFIFGDKNYVSNSRVFLAGKRQYRIDIISAKGKEDAEMNKKVFQSLLIKDVEPVR